MTRTVCDKFRKTVMKNVINSGDLLKDGQGGTIVFEFLVLCHVWPSILER